MLYVTELDLNHNKWVIKTMVDGHEQMNHNLTRKITSEMPIPTARENSIRHLYIQNLQCNLCNGTEAITHTKKRK